jgi:excisionase family DNA binding protein
MSHQKPWRRRPIADDEPLLRTSEVAKRLQVSPRTVLAWAMAGKIPSFLTPGGHRRFPESAIADLMVPRNEHTGEVVQ